MNVISMSVILLSVLCLLPHVYSLKCWTCRSDFDSKCADPFDNTTLPITDCRFEIGLSNFPNIGRSFCRKIRQKVDGKMVTIRGCTWKAQDDNSDMCPTFNNEVPDLCETCEYDGCNGAVTISSTLALLVAPLGPLLLK